MVPRVPSRPTNMLAPGSRGAEPRSAITVTRATAACLERYAAAASTHWPASGANQSPATNDALRDWSRGTLIGHAPQGWMNRTSCGALRTMRADGAQHCLGGGWCGQVRQAAARATRRAGVTDGMKHRQGQHQRRLADGLGSEYGFFGIRR